MHESRGQFHLDGDLMRKISH